MREGLLTHEMGGQATIISRYFANAPFVFFHYLPHFIGISIRRYLRER